MSSDRIQQAFSEASDTLRAFVESADGLTRVQEFADAARKTLKSGVLLMACGNGGSMCDAMHFAEEFTGRFRRDRDPLPAIAFSDPSQITCIANDFGYDEVFARQVAAHGKAGDLLVAISTSGNSVNILRAIQVAKEKHVTTIGLAGGDGGKMKSEVDIPILVPQAATSDRVQEIHMLVLHIAIEMVERELFPHNYPGPDEA